MKNILAQSSFVIAMICAIITGMFYYYGPITQWAYGEAVNDDPVGFILAICIFVMVFVSIREWTSRK